MRVPTYFKRLAIVITVFGTSAITASAQQPQNQNPDVIKVTTSLVQTDVMVFDKQGKFVDGLKREQFTLKVDGKPREIAFFELIKAGSSNEEAQLAAARGVASNAGAPMPLDRGRVIYFFVDDLHLSHGSLSHVRSLLSRFVEREAGQNDRIAIVAASGQIGFLQQLTDNKTVLRRAIERLSLRSRSTRDFESPQMSEHHAELIDRNDEGVFEYFVEALVKTGVPRHIAAQMVRQRASAILEQAAHFSINSLQTLHYLVKSAADLPGRKLVFFISDGFLINSRDTVRQRVHGLTTLAARNGVVIYSIDARGLVASLADPSDLTDFDPTGRLLRASTSELTRSQDGMNALAVDTGGRALFNTNDLFQSVRTGLAETSKYYLLAWRPESATEKDKTNRRLGVAIEGRPDLLVRFRRNFGDSEALISNSKQPPKVHTINEALRDTLRAEYPRTSLPVNVTLNFLNLPNRGSFLATSLKIGTADIPLEIVNGNATAQIDLAVAVMDDQGNSVKTFNKTLNLRSTATSGNPTPPESVVYHNYLGMKPGLYQVRVAVVERKERRAGGASDWIEIPNLETKSLAMSTLIVAERAAETKSMDAAAKDNSQDPDADPLKSSRLNIDHRFSRDSRLRLLTFVYNAATAAGPISGPASTTAPASVTAPAALPDLVIQIQVFRDDQPVITAPGQKIQTQGVSDLTRVPYAAEVNLEGLQPANYVLRVTVIDRIAKATTSQRFKFRVD